MIEHKAKGINKLSKKVFSSEKNLVSILVAKCAIIVYTSLSRTWLSLQEKYFWSKRILIEETSHNLICYCNTSIKVDLRVIIRHPVTILMRVKVASKWVKNGGK